MEDLEILEMFEEHTKVHLIIIKSLTEHLYDLEGKVAAIQSRILLMEERERGLSRSGDVWTA